MRLRGWSIGALVLAACQQAPLDLGTDASVVEAGLSDGGLGRDLGATPEDAGVADAALDDRGGGAWISLPPLPAGPRQETAVVALRGEVYVIGGFDDNGQFGPVVEAYSPDLASWRRVADLPIPLHHANAAVLDDQIYLLGFLGTAFQEDARCFRYDPDADVWTARPPWPAARARGAAAVAVLEGRVYLVGGLRRGAPVADFDVYDPASGTFSPLPPLPRLADHLVAGALRGRILAVGGRAGSITGHTGQVDLYDPTLGNWSAGAPMPTSRGGAAAAVFGNSLYVLGGEGNSQLASGVFDAVERWDADSQAWSVLPPMTAGRHGTGAVAVGDRIYLPGGASVMAFGATDRVEALIP